MILMLQDTVVLYQDQTASTVFERSAHLRSYKIYRSETVGFVHGNTNKPYTGSYTAFTYDEKSEIKPLTSCG
jgi:hypothetical protein